MHKRLTGRTLLGVIIGMLLLAALLPAAASASKWGYRPQNVTAVELPDGIEVSWSPPTDNAAAVTGYKVIRKTPGVDTKFTVVSKVVETTWFDTDATEDGRTYNYKVKAVRGARVGKSSRKAAVTRSVQTALVVSPETLETARFHINDTTLVQLDEQFTISRSNERNQTFTPVRLSKNFVYVIEVYETGPEWILGNLQWSVKIKNDSGATVKSISNISGPGQSLREEFLITIGPQTHDYDIEVQLLSGPYEKSTTESTNESTNVWVPGLEIEARARIYAYQTPIDDCTGELNTNCTVRTGSPVNGHFHDDYDTDWYRVSLGPNFFYEISMTPDGTEDAAAAAWINGIYNSDGDFLSNDGSVVEGPQATGSAYHTAAGGVGTHDSVARTTIETQSGGDHYIALGSYGSIGNREGHYTLLVVGTSGGELDGDDFAPGFNIRGNFYHGHEAGLSGLWGPVIVGYKNYGNIEHDRDRDWFRIPLVAGTQYRATMRGITLHDAQIGGVYGTDRRTLVVDPPPLDEWRPRDGPPNGSLDSRLDFTVPTTGTYYIEATTPPSIVSFNNLGRYSLTVLVRR